MWKNLKSLMCLFADILNYSDTVYMDALQNKSISCPLWGTRSDAGTLFTTLKLIRVKRDFCTKRPQRSPGLTNASSQQWAGFKKQPLDLSGRFCCHVPYRSPVGAVRWWKPSPRRCGAATAQRARWTSPSPREPRWLRTSWLRQKKAKKTKRHTRFGMRPTAGVSH